MFQFVSKSTAYVPLNAKLKNPKSGPLLPGFILNLGQIS